MEPTFAAHSHGNFDFTEQRTLTPARSFAVLVRRQTTGALGLTILMTPAAPEVVETFGPLKKSPATPSNSASKVPVVVEVDPASALVDTVRPGDHIVAIGAVETAGMVLEDVFALLASAPEHTAMTIVRVEVSATPRSVSPRGIVAPAPRRSVLNVSTLSAAQKANFGRRASRILESIPHIDPATLQPPLSPPVRAVSPIAAAGPGGVLLSRGDTGHFGVTFIKTPRGLVVEGVSPASPAGLAGTLHPGDTVTYIDGTPIVGTDLPAALGLMQGKHNVVVTLALARPPSTSSVGSARGPSPPPVSPRSPVPRPAALVLPPAVCHPLDAHLNSTWGRRMAALRSLPPHLYLKEGEECKAPNGSFATVSGDAAPWWLPSEGPTPSATREAEALLDAGLAHFATGGLPCRPDVFRRIVSEATPATVAQGYLRPAFDFAAARWPGATGPAGPTIRVGSDVAAARFPSYGPLLELLRAWSVRRGSAAAGGDASVPWAEFLAFFEAWHDAFGTAELAWLVSAIYPPAAAHGEGGAWVVAPGGQPAAAGTPGAPPPTSDVGTWLEACGSLVGDEWVVDGVDVLLPTAAAAAASAGDSLAALASVVAPRPAAGGGGGRSAEWQGVFHAARRSVVEALVGPRPVSSHAVFIPGRGLQRVAAGSGAKPGAALPALHLEPEAAGGGALAAAAAADPADPAAEAARCNAALQVASDEAYAAASALAKVPPEDEQGRQAAQAAVGAAEVKLIDAATAAAHAAAAATPAPKRERAVASAVAMNEAVDAAFEAAGAAAGEAKRKADEAASAAAARYIAAIKEIAEADSASKPPTLCARAVAAAAATAAGTLAVIAAAAAAPKEVAAAIDAVSPKEGKGDRQRTADAATSTAEALVAAYVAATLEQDTATAEHVRQTQVEGASAVCAARFEAASRVARAPHELRTRALAVSMAVSGALRSIPEKRPSGGEGGALPDTRRLALLAPIAYALASSDVSAAHASAAQLPSSSPPSPTAPTAAVSPEVARHAVDFIVAAVVAALDGVHADTRARHVAAAAAAAEAVTKVHYGGKPPEEPALAPDAHRDSGLGWDRSCRSDARVCDEGECAVQ